MQQNGTSPQEQQSPRSTRPEPLSEEPASDLELEAYADGIRYNEWAKAARTLLRSLPEVSPSLKELLGTWADKEKERIKVVSDASYRTTWQFLLGLTVSLAFLTGLVLILKDQKDVLVSTLAAIVPLMSFAGGGWLFGQRAKRG
jgi:hypothetical protein